MSSSTRRASSPERQHGGLFIPPKHAYLQPTDVPPSFTFVCIGVGGGPLETDCSCYMLKPAHRHWSQGSVVLEGGSWLGALSRVLENVGPDSAFHDLDFPFDSPTLRAGWLGSYAHSFLVSHAHLDHILGLVLGSASLPDKRKVYGLKGTLDNLMGAFNGKIWPRLASWDEGGPAVYNLKALEPLLKAKVDKDLSVLPFPLSHGLNPSVIPAPPTPTQVYPPRLSVSSKRLSLPLTGYFPNTPSMPVPPPSFGVLTSGGGINQDRPVFTSPFAPESAITEQVASLDLDSKEVISVVSSDASPTSTPPTTPSMLPPLSSRTGNSLRLSSRARRPRTAQGSESTAFPDPSSSSRASSIAAGAPAQNGLAGLRSAGPRRISIDHGHHALDSTAFFITNDITGREVLFFGDVEPDSVSENPRNGRIWAHAAQRFAEDMLNTIFLECSFPASHPTEFLYGHLSVVHVFDELRTLARSVVAERKRSSVRRQRATSRNSTTPYKMYGNSNGKGIEGLSRRNLASQLPPIPALHTSERTITEDELKGSLTGMHVVIIHVKTALFPSFEATPRPSTSSTSSFRTAGSNGPSSIVGEDSGSTITGDTSSETLSKPPVLGRHMDLRSMQTRILDELQEREAEIGLGVNFVMARQGMRIEC